MDRKNLYRLIVSVRVTDAEYKTSYGYYSTTEIDASELDSVGYLASNVATYLGRSAGMAAMRGEGLSVGPLDQAEPLSD